MKINNMRLAIAVLFVAGFLACIAALFVAYHKGTIDQDIAFDILKTLFPLYMTPIGVILGVMFGPGALGVSKANRKKNEARLPLPQSIFAIFSVILWNSLVVYRFWAYAYGAGTEVDLKSYFTEVIPLAASLISTVLAAFFTIEPTS